MKYRFEIKIYFYMKPLTLSDLRIRQAWPLNQKIDHTCYAMETFVAYCKEHDRTPYVSFSGGLNSTVLLDLARRFVAPNMKGVFCSTGNEYPEIVRFVRHTDNIEIIHPAMTPTRGHGPIWVSSCKQRAGASCPKYSDDQQRQITDI